MSNDISDTDFDTLSNTWERFGEIDAMWAVCSDPDKLGGGWKEDDFFQTGEQEIAASMAELSELGAKIPFEAAMDFGCGLGRLSRAISKRAESVTSVDIAASMLEQARALNAAYTNIQFVHNTKTDLSIFENGRFDLVYTNIVLQHMRPRFALAYIAEFFRIARPSGWVVFQLPDTDTLSTRRRLHNLIQNEIAPRLPEGAKQVLRKIRYRNAGNDTLHNLPFAQMFGVSRRKVISLIEQHGGRVIKAEVGTDADYGWDSIRYFARRLP